MDPDRALVDKHLRDRYRDYQWREVTVGHSGSVVAHLTGPADLHLKYGPDPLHPDPGYDIGAEYDRLRWMAAQGLPVPEVVECDVFDGHTYLVATTVSGRDAASPWPAHERMRVIDAVADFARDLHALSTTGCPFDRSLRVTVPNARVAVALGQVDLDGAGPQQALTELDAALRGNDTEDLVLTHGDYCLPNVLLDPETLTVTGVVDVGRFGLADRYTDLTTMAGSIDGPLNPQYTREHTDRFLWRYGLARLDEAKAGFYGVLRRFM
ncbi:aminoglycoside 3'-phosphotransferase [Phytomonospora endophytica]|uniref:Aminoglycoside phosphotransferase n=1 Tax=Phytomonospora endophytica TaxID=714109 RepID=A0A841FE15_9ACTN|nr:aminoglycoside 3'-phosphotransferase [Phytomonospora endophytica]MBB6033745.1 aminoglycoside phosphotransferase [Phytomonospora endophytica]GIG64738.1 putative streptomycin phosphotransferase [Phytomonospora endophytica]